MPAKLAVRPAAPAGSVPVVDLSAVSAELFEDATAGGVARVGVRLMLNLSFAEVLGLLTFAPSVFLTFKSLESDMELHYALSFALVGSDAFKVQEWAGLAMVLLADAPASEFIAQMGAAVTRVFGIAPAGADL